MTIESWMGEVRSLLEIPTPENFQALVSVVVAADLPPETTLEQLFPYVTERLRKDWPDHIPRHVPPETRDAVMAREDPLPLYRWTMPLDLSLMPPEALAAHPYDYGDGGLGQNASFREVLETKFGLEPVRVTIDAAEVETFFGNPAQRGSYTLINVHHGDLHITGDTQNAMGFNSDERLVTITGDLTFSGPAQLHSFFGLGIGGDLRAPRIWLDGMTEVEGTIVTRHGIFQVYESEMDANVLEAEFAMFFLGRFGDTSPSRLALSLSSGPYIREDELEQLRAALTVDVFESMEAYVLARPEESDAAMRFAWLRDELPKLLEDPNVVVWRAPS